MCCDTGTDTRAKCMTCRESEHEANGWVMVDPLWVKRSRVAYLPQQFKRFCHVERRHRVWRPVYMLLQDGRVNRRGLLQILRDPVRREKLLTIMVVGEWATRYRWGFGPCPIPEELAII